MQEAHPTTPRDDGRSLTLVRRATAASAAALLCLLALGAPEPAQAQQPERVLTFEGLQDFEPVSEFYNGGLGGLGSPGGENFGVSFPETSLALIDSDAGGSGNFGGEPSPDTVLFFETGTEARMNVPAGFTDGFSFFYSSIHVVGNIRVYSGVDGTGNLLAELELPITPSEPTPEDSGSYNPFFPFGVAFTGVARSVDFGGNAGDIAFDNITLGNPAPGSEECPRPKNLFGVPDLIVYSGSGRPECVELHPIPQLAMGPNLDLPVYVTAGDQPSDPNPIAGVRGPEVPCAMPLNAETSALPDDRITASGDEICGLDVIVEIDRGTGVITDFVPTDPRTHVFPSPPFPDARSVRLVGLYTDAPLATPFFHELGKISFDVTPGPNESPSTIRVVAKAGTGGQPIGSGTPPYANLYAALGVAGMPADLAPRPAIQTVLYVPEPAAWLQVPSALLALALLAAWRRLRSERRAAVPLRRARPERAGGRRA